MIFFLLTINRHVAQEELNAADQEKIIGIAVLSFISLVTLVFYFFVKNALSVIRVSVHPKEVWSYGPKKTIEESSLLLWVLVRNASQTKDKFLSFFSRSVYNRIITESSLDICHRSN